MFLQILIFFLFSIQQSFKVNAACTFLDHQACDEVCKTDNFWYGHCIGWDGINFSCKCYEYEAPLNGTICIPRQIACSEKCKDQGSEGGFCFPQFDSKKRLRTACECFKKLQNIFRRRKRSLNYLRV